MTHCIDCGHEFGPFEPFSLAWRGVQVAVCSGCVLRAFARLRANRPTVPVGSG